MPLKPSLLRFKFDDFANLPFEPNRFVYSEDMDDCHGNSWGLIITPVGMSVSDDLFVGVNLGHLEERIAPTSYSFILRDVHGKVFHEKSMKDLQTPFSSMDFCHLVKRSTILDKTNGILVGGALLIDVHLQFMFTPEPYSMHAPRPFLDKALKLFENGEGDVLFKVGDEVINAHRLILQINASVLFDFCEEHSDASPISINGTTPEIFRIILRYAYGGEVPDAAMIEAKGKIIIDAADKFGVVDLKIAVEITLVKKLVLDLDNVVDWLLFADAKTCPLLKEQAIAYFMSRSADILNSDASKELKESPKLMSELILGAGMSGNRDDRFGEEQHLSVSELRNRLHEKGLDVDGSKEILISRLQESSKRHGEE